jgi:hypothetical protein
LHAANAIALLFQSTRLVAVASRRCGIVSLGLMIIQPLGKLEPDPDIPEWLRSTPVTVPYFGGLQLAFVLLGVEDDPAPADFENALSAFFRLGSAEREEAARYVFQLYRQFVEAIGEDEFDFTIPSASAVWDFVTPTEIHVSRRHRRDRLIYVEILAECRWEIEHGLVVIYRSGSTLSRVSEQDGHLTTSDAFDFPEERDTILYEA